MLVSKRIPLLRFRKPEYMTRPGLARSPGGSSGASWSPPPAAARAICGSRSGGSTPSDRPTTSACLVRTEVSNFYPFLRGGGWFARIGVRIYNQPSCGSTSWSRTASCARCPPRSAAVAGRRARESSEQSDGDGIVERPPKPGPTGSSASSTARSASPLDGGALDRRRAPSRLVLTTVSVPRPSTAAARRPRRPASRARSSATRASGVSTGTPSRGRGRMPIASAIASIIPP